MTDLNSEKDLLTPRVKHLCIQLDAQEQESEK